MSRAAYTAKDKHTGLGNLAAYAFTFKIEAKSQLEVVEYNSAGVETQRVRGTDTSTYVSSVVFDADAGGGTVTLLANLTLNSDLYLILANDAPTQPTELRNKQAFVLKTIENAFDFMVGPIQRLAYLAARSLRVHDNVSDSFDPKLPTPVATNVLGWAADSLSIRNVTPGELLLGASLVTTTTDLPEGTNLYFTLARAIAAVQTTATVETITSGGDIASSTATVLQYRPVVGDAGAQSASTTPFGSTGGWLNGTQVVLRGTSDTNTVQITHNDAAKGAILNGNALLAKNNVLTLIYDSTDDRWIEVSRNF